MFVIIISAALAFGSFIAAHHRGEIPAAIILLGAIGYLVGTPETIGHGVWWEYLVAPAFIILAGYLGDMVFADPLEEYLQLFQELKGEDEDIDEHLEGYR